MHVQLLISASILEDYMHCGAVSRRCSRKSFTQIKGCSGKRKVSCLSKEGCSFMFFSADTFLVFSFSAQFILAWVRLARVQLHFINIIWYSFSCWQGWNYLNELSIEVAVFSVAKLLHLVVRLKDAGYQEKSLNYKILLRCRVTHRAELFFINS